MVYKRWSKSRKTVLQSKEESLAQGSMSSCRRDRLKFRSPCWYLMNASKLLRMKCKWDYRSSKGRDLKLHPLKKFIRWKRKSTIESGQLSNRQEVQLKSHRNKRESSKKTIPSFRKKKYNSQQKVKPQITFYWMTNNRWSSGNLSWAVYIETHKWLSLTLAKYLSCKPDHHQKSPWM